MWWSDEAFYETEMERVVGVAGHAVAIATLAHAVGTVSTACTLYETDFGVDGRDDAVALQGSESPGLELGDGCWRRCARRLDFERRRGRVFAAVVVWVDI
jgi:hypothetical protein